MISLFVGLTLSFVALGGAITTIEMTMTRKRKQWLEKMRQPFTLESASHTVKTKPSAKPIHIYEDEFATYTLAPQGHLWYVTSKWKGASNPYLKYMYNPSNGAVTHIKLYKDEVPFYISTKELKEGMEWIQSGVSEHIQRYHKQGPTYSKAETSSASTKNTYQDMWDILLQVLQNEEYKIVEHNETKLKVLLYQEQYLSFEEKDEKELFEYGKMIYGNCLPKYQIARHKETHKISHYKMDDTLIHKTKDIKEFAFKQERLWRALKNIAQTHRKKHKQLQAFFEATQDTETYKEIPISSDKPTTIKEYQIYFEKNRDYMTDEDVWYVTQILPKRIHEVNQFIQRHPDAATFFCLNVEEKLLERLEGVYLRLQANIEREKVRLKKVVEIEN